jgi:hypothetical protein
VLLFAPHGAFDTDQLEYGRARPLDHTGLMPTNR